VVDVISDCLESFFVLGVYWDVFVVRVVDFLDLIVDLVAKSLPALMGLLVAQNDDVVVSLEDFSQGSIRLPLRNPTLRDYAHWLSFVEASPQFLII
jgi:uncharacterized protein YpmS